MVDYYIFYGRDGDDDRTTPLRAHINSDKPNRNNYFLPFNNVTSYNGNTFYAQNVKLDNGSYDYDHMNYTVGDNYDANGKIMVQLEFDENGKYVGGDEAFYALFPYAADVREAYANGTLPNGMSLKNQKVWYTKVPNGFANPAGTHFAVAFRNSADKASYRDTEMKYPLWTPLGTRHLYFFDGIHMHVSNTSWSDLCDTEIAYRVYTYDINYNNVVVDYSKRDESDPNSLYMLYVKASAGSRPANTTDDDNDAWITLSSDHLACDMWKSGEGRSSCSCPFIEGKGEIHDWRVADTEPDVTTSVNRNEIPAGLAAARVQFRIKVSPKGSAARAAGSNFEPYTVYFPEAPTIGQKDDEVRLQGVDHYMVMDNESGVWTAIKNVLEDNGFDLGEDNSAPVYYNLQGVRVEKPGKGLHIVVRGNKSEKILF
ncbi:MAG: hypothetical protein K2I45_07350 [Muribaculaceae bacterium]|nr:hypothetical protein [Muribaculaceae bacterium]